MPLCQVGNRLFPRRFRTGSLGSGDLQEVVLFPISHGDGGYT